MHQSVEILHLGLLMHQSEEIPPGTFIILFFLRLARTSCTTFNVHLFVCTVIAVLSSSPMTLSTPLPRSTPSSLVPSPCHPCFLSTLSLPSPCYDRHPLHPPSHRPPCHPRNPRHPRHSCYHCHSPDPKID